MRETEIICDINLLRPLARAPRRVHQVIPPDLRREIVSEYCRSARTAKEVADLLGIAADSTRLVLRRADVVRPRGYSIDMDVFLVVLEVVAEGGWVKDAAAALQTRISQKLHRHVRSASAVLEPWVEWARAAHVAGRSWSEISGALGMNRELVAGLVSRSVVVRAALLGGEAVALDGARAGEIPPPDEVPARDIFTF